MKSLNKKTALLLIASLLAGCNTVNPSIPVNNQQFNQFSPDKSGYALVRFKFDFPAKFLPKISNNKFSTQAVNPGKINRVRVTITSADSDYSIERNVDLVPGGIEASLSLPLDKLYIVKVLGLNNTEPVSGAEVKGYFSLKSSNNSPTINVNQSTSPAGAILELLKSRIDADKASATTGTGTDNAGTGTDNAGAGTDNAATGTDNAGAGTDNAGDGTDNAGTGTATDSNTIVNTSNFKLSDLSMEKLQKFVDRARGAMHPSLVNVQALADLIYTEKKVPDLVPENALLKPGRIKGTVSGLKQNEVAIITIGDPASNPTMVTSPVLVAKTGITTDPDTIMPAIDFVVDNVAPGDWPAEIVASGYTEAGSTDTAPKTVTITTDAETSLSFSLTAGAWLPVPNNLSGSIGNSEETETVLDSNDNIHAVWRQDGFDTDINSGVIYYSRWNGTSWTSQAKNISQINNSEIRGSKQPSIAIGLDRLPHVIWSALNSSGERAIYYNNFNGINWDSPKQISGSTDADSPSLVVDKTNGYLYGAWHADGNIYIAQYNKEAWSSTLFVGEGSMPKLSMGTDGIVHITWKGVDSHTIKYASWSLKNGLSSIVNVPFLKNGRDMENWIDTAIDRYNRLHILWRNDVYIQYILRSNKGWSQPEMVNQVSTALMPAESGASLSVSPSGIVNAAWVSSGTNGTQVVRFRRRLNNGWKLPYKDIFDPNEDTSTTTEETTTTDEDTTTTIAHTENIDGYEDIPLSQISKTKGSPEVIVTNSGVIHVLWSEIGNNDTDLLHSFKK